MHQIPLFLQSTPVSLFLLERLVGGNLAAVAGFGVQVVAGTLGAHLGASAIERVVTRFFGAS